jgi:hypothetical protein
MQDRVVRLLLVKPLLGARRVLGVQQRCAQTGAGFDGVVGPKTWQVVDALENEGDALLPRKN